VAALKSQPVAAVELMDRASIRSVENKAGMPPFFKDLPETAAALLVETRAHGLGEPDRSGRSHHRRHRRPADPAPYQFTDRPEEFTQLWAIRQGLFPSVGSARATGTTVIIEDVAVPVPQLAAMTLDLQRLFDQHGYTGSIIFGHALEGNLHFVITPISAKPAETERYKNFMDDVCGMIVHQVRRLAEGGTRHRPQHRAVRRTGMGPAGVSIDAGDQGAVRSAQPAESRRDPQRRPGSAPQKHQADGRCRSAGGQVHRVRLLRAELSVPRPDPVAAPAHRRLARNGALASAGEDASRLQAIERRINIRAWTPAPPTACVP
jgi:hypothetical protein